MPTRPPTFKPRYSPTPKRETAVERGYGRKWQAARLTYLKANPLCVMCKARGEVVAASVVDHVKAHKGNHALFWDEGNWQALCARHHNQKTATEDGGFGRLASQKCEEGVEFRNNRKNEGG